MKANVENVEYYVWAVICLHNYLRLTENATYTLAGFVDSRSSLGDIRDNLGFQDIKKIRRSHRNKLFNDVRYSTNDLIVMLIVKVACGMAA